MACNISDRVGHVCRKFNIVLVADCGRKSKNNITRPSAVMVDVVGSDLHQSEGSGNFWDHIGCCIGRGGKISLEAVVVVIGSFDRYEGEGLWFGTGINNFEDVVVGYELREGSVSLDDQLVVQAGALWLRNRWCRVLLVCNLCKVVFAGGSGRYVGKGVSHSLPDGATGLILVLLLL